MSKHHHTTPYYSSLHGRLKTVWSRMKCTPNVRKNTRDYRIFLRPTNRRRLSGFVVTSWWVCCMPIQYNPFHWLPIIKGISLKRVILNSWIFCINYTRNVQQYTCGLWPLVWCIIAMQGYIQDSIRHKPE